MPTQFGDSTPIPIMRFAPLGYHQFFPSTSPDIYHRYPEPSAKMAVQLRPVPRHVMDRSQSQGVDEEGASFGVRLRRAREAAGLTQEELAGRAALTPNTVGALERGEHLYPYPATVRALTAAMGLSPKAVATLMASVPTRRGISAVMPPLRPPTPLSPLIGRQREL